MSKNPAATMIPITIKNKIADISVNKFLFTICNAQK